jgi:hypothetical protein
VARARHGAAVAITLGLLAGAVVAPGVFFLVLAAALVTVTANALTRHRRNVR